MQQTNDQFEKTERFYSLSSFQNGGLVSGERTIFAKRLDVQSASKGCLLLHTNPSDFTEELTFRMGRFCLSVSLPLFRVIPNPIGVYKTIESSNSLVQKTESEADYPSRRYFADDIIKGITRDKEGRIDFSITTSRLCNKCEKVFTLPDKNHRIPWDYNKFD